MSLMDECTVTELASVSAVESAYVSGMLFCLGFQAHASPTNDHLQKHASYCERIPPSRPLHILDLVVHTGNLVDVQFRLPDGMQQNAFDSFDDGRMPLHRLVKSFDNFSEKSSLHGTLESGHTLRLFHPMCVMFLSIHRFSVLFCSKTATNCAACGRLPEKSAPMSSASFPRLVPTRCAYKINRKTFDE